MGSRINTLNKDQVNQPKSSSPMKASGAGRDLQQEEQQEQQGKWEVGRSIRQSSCRSSREALAWEK